MTPETKWTEEDLAPQACVAAVIQGPNDTILLQHHKKLQKWTVPMGKAPADADRDGIRIAMVKELKEECGITVDPAHLDLINMAFNEVERAGVKMRVMFYLFLVTKYEGEIVNAEPHKHTQQQFLNPMRLLVQKEPISMALEMWLDCTSTPT